MFIRCSQVENVKGDGFVYSAVQEDDTADISGHRGVAEGGGKDDMNSLGDDLGGVSSPRCLPKEEDSSIDVIVEVHLTKGGDWGVSYVHGVVCASQFSLFVLY